MPAWFERFVPQLHVEGRPEVHLPAQRSAEPEPEAVPAG